MRQAAKQRKCLSYIPPAEVNIIGDMMDKDVNISGRRKQSPHKDTAAMH